MVPRRGCEPNSPKTSQIRALAVLHLHSLCRPLVPSFEACDQGPAGRRRVHERDGEMIERGTMGERMTAAELATVGAVLELEDGSLVYNMGGGMLAFDQLDDTIAGTDEQKTIRVVLPIEDVRRMAALPC